MFGICRGTQEANVALGGSLSAHANADAPGLTVWFRLPEDTPMDAEKETP